MRYRQYRFKFYLNASHAITIDGSLGARHPHTWELAINTLKLQNSFLEFNVLEKKLEDFLNQYQDSYLNEVAPFDSINPTLENCCDYFKEKLKLLLNDEGWILLMIEMSETPTRSYIINLLDETQQETGAQSTEAIADTILKDIITLDIK